MQVTTSDESFLSDNDILNIVLEKEQEMVEAIEDWIEGLINPLIIRGPAGTGKTETISTMTKKAGLQSTDLLSTLFDERSGEGFEPTKVDGALIRGSDYSPWALFADLYGNRDEGMLVLDDNDAILKDREGAALIMAATEKKPTRRVTYTKAMSGNDLRQLQVPPVFETRCPIAILTNFDMQMAIDVANAKAKEKGKVKETHIVRWEALMSRGRHIDLQMNTPRSVRVFCEHKVQTAGILTKSAYLESLFSRSLTKKEEQEVLKWVRFNQGKLASALDLRTYIKVAVTMLKRKKDWVRSAEVAYLKRA